MFNKKCVWFEKGKREVKSYVCLENNFKTTPKEVNQQKTSHKLPYQKSVKTIFKKNQKRKGTKPKQKGVLPFLCKLVKNLLTPWPLEKEFQFFPFFTPKIEKSSPNNQDWVIQVGQHQT